jgi:hypothetical protein
MAVNKKPTKAAKLNLVKAADIIEKFSSSSAEKDLSDSPLQDILNITETYRIKNDGTPLAFTLRYRNPGVGAISNGKLHNPLTSKNTVIVNKEKDSLINHSIAVDTVANKQFLEIRSTVAASDLTPVPTDLSVEFSISGGVEDKEFSIPASAFKEVGDQIILDISIFFF